MYCNLVISMIRPYLSGVHWWRELRFVRTFLRASSVAVAGRRPNMVVPCFLEVAGTMTVGDITPMGEAVVLIGEPLDGCWSPLLGCERK